MKYCVMANLTFETPAKRDTITKEFKNFLVDKLTWGKTKLSEGMDYEGKPSNGIIVRFDNRKDMDDLFALIKGKMDKIPVLKGEVSRHDCLHDEGGKCEIWERFVKE